MIPEGLLMQAAKPLIDTLIAKIIKPKLEKFAEACSLKYDELLIPKGSISRSIYIVPIRNIV